MKSLRKIPDVFGAASAVLIFLIWLMMTVEVAARNIFSSPILGVSEIGIYLYVTAVYFGFAYTQKWKGHIAVELLYDQLGPRAKKIADLIVCLLSGVLFISFAFCLWKAFAESWAIKEIYLSAMKMPVYLLKFTIALGVSVMLLQLLIDAVEAARAVFQPGPAGAAAWKVS
ncbi:MAG: TRAP transporter small permease subunit [Candidatus Adiutrix sp.]|jgi:TRAP-type C4-dicarboxylate transport system permease small subunit|nr:TRAP transporter small permease subunit [Candidatus Adiutrix sp.]